MEFSMSCARYPSGLEARDIEYARDFLNETPEKQREYLHKLRGHFTRNEPHIKLSTEDEILVAFLRGCKYDLPRAINKVKNYYLMRFELPSIFSARDPTTDRMQELLRIGYFVPLRKLQNGRITIIIRPAAYNPKEYTFEEILKIGYVILDVCSKICPLIQVHGVCTVFDMKDISVGHVRPMTPTIIKHIVNSWENYHCRPKQLEFINAPLYLNVVLSIFKSFMSTKLKERVRVHYGGHLSLHDFLDKAVLPEEYGGDDGAFRQHADFWVDKVGEFREWLIFDEQLTAIQTNDNDNEID